MATYQIETEDGQVYEIEADEAAPQGVAGAAKDMLASASPNNLMAGLGNMVTEGFDKAGENVAQNLASGVSMQPTEMIPGVPASSMPSLQPTPGEGLRMDPTAAAAVGTGVQHIPDLITATEGGSAMGQGVNKLLAKIKAFHQRPSVEEAKVLLKEAEAALAAKPSAVEKATELADETAKPLKNTIENLRQKATEIPETFRNKAKTLLQAKRGAGKAMGEAEQAMGAQIKPDKRFEAVVRSPEKMAKVADRANRIAEKGADYVKENLKPQRIQLYRKLIQEGGDKLSTFGKANAEKSREVFASVLSDTSTMFKEARGNFQQITKAIEELPAAQKAAKEGVKRQLIKAQSELEALEKQSMRLKDQARKADRMELKQIRLEGLKLIRQAAEKEKLLKRLGYGIVGTTIVGGAGAAAKKLIQ